MEILIVKSITSDPDILGGKPILRGTRIAVEFLLISLKAHIPTEEILKEYPSITKDPLEEFLNLANLFQHHLSETDLTFYSKQVYSTP